MILALLCVRVTQAIVGFDCTAPATNITAISLSSVSSCPTHDPHLREHSVVVQLLQSRQYDHTNYYACLVTRSILITHCGMESHASAHAAGFKVGQVLSVSREACMLMHQGGFYITPMGFKIGGLKPNATSEETMTEAGTLDGSRCQQATFNLEGKTYVNSVMQSSYTITLTSGALSIALEPSNVILPSGVNAPLKSGTTFDADQGYVFWDTEANGGQCSDRSYYVLYQGPATIFKGSSGTETLVVNTTERALAVSLTSKTLLCHQPARMTDHPRLFVIVSSYDGESFFFKDQGKMDILDIDPLLHTNSKLVYIEKHLSRELSRMCLMLSQKICDINHQLLSQLISLAYIQPEEFAWAYTQKQGRTAIVKGEVVYVLACPPVYTELRRTPNVCFQEIPVTYNGTDMFLKPRSRMLVNYGTEIECSPIAPALYKLQGKWIKMNPEPSSAISPVELSAGSSIEWEYSEPYHLKAAGIYSDTDMEAYQRRLLFPIEKPAITNIISRSVASGDVDTQGIQGMNLVGMDAFEKAQRSFMEKIYGWYWSVTIHTASITGLFVLLYVCKSIVDTFVNGALLYKTFGWSLKLVSAVWGSCAKHLVLKEVSKQATAPPHEQIPLEQVVTYDELHKLLNPPHKGLREEVRIEADGVMPEPTVTAR